MSKGPNDKDCSKSEALKSHEKPQIESLGAWIGIMTCVYSMAAQQSLVCG